MGIASFVYIDDFVLVSPPEFTSLHFKAVKEVLSYLGFEVSDKAAGCVQGEAGVDTEALGLNYRVSADGVQIRVGDDKLDALKL